MYQKSKLTDQEIVDLYSKDTPIKDICEMAEITRSSLYNSLKRSGIETGRREVLLMICPNCGQKFTRPKSHNKGKLAGYCSIQCFHQDRTISGEYDMIGDKLVKVSKDINKSDIMRKMYYRQARAELKRNGIELKEGQVIHHINGQIDCNTIDNLMIFDNHSEHMKYHHSLRKKKNIVNDANVKLHKVYTRGKLPHGLKVTIDKLTVEQYKPFIEMLKENSTMKEHNRQMAIEYINKILAKQRDSVVESM